MGTEPNADLVKGAYDGGSRMCEKQGSPVGMETECQGMGEKTETDVDMD